MKFAFAEVVWLRMFFEPCQLQFEIAVLVFQINDFKRSVWPVDFTARLQAKSFAIKGDASLKVGDVDVEMVEFR